MGEVIYLAHHIARRQKTKLKVRRKKLPPAIRREKLRVFKDLKGKRPKGHPKVKRGKRGKVILQVGQVWVEGHTQRLWVLTDMAVARKSFYKHDVIMSAYKSSGFQIFSEATLRMTMTIWDDWGAEQKALMKKLTYMSENDPESPWRGHIDAGKLARVFFGLDSKGNRTK
ncbi:MAG: hypothetical protein KGI70_01545 [Patescibacteria group bacterium]|nr:hypothetical protein [Patescibacteria group bacterium]